MNLHANIDLETLGTGHDAVIGQIGLAIFDPLKQTIHAQYQWFVDWTNQPGRLIDPETLLWWMKQNQTMYQRVWMNNLASSKALPTALFGAKSVLAQHQVENIWSNGISFDLMILEHAYKQYGMEIPWKFYHHRDQRTIKNIITTICGDDFEVIPPNESKHDALADATWQARYVQEATLLLSSGRHLAREPLPG